MNKLLLCTDMDRTIIPNGMQLEHERAREIFRQLCSQPELELAYVTGRHLGLLEEALKEYELPEPDYALTDVGTSIYKNVSAGWSNMQGWQDQIAKDWRGKSHAELQEALSIFDELQLQESSKQGPFKLSYYCPLSMDLEAVTVAVGETLARRGVDAAVIPSIDEPEAVGLLDILPLRATKLHAILHLQNYLGYKKSDVVFAGDSGNDLSVLTSNVLSILVANASEEVRMQARRSVHDEGRERSLFCAKNNGFELGGNYAAGVVQGVLHYKPEIKSRLDLS